MRLKKIIVIIGCLLTVCSISSSDMAQAEFNDSERTNYEVALNYLANKEYVQAVKYFKMVIAGNPENSPAFYNLGVAYKALGMSEESKIAFERAFELRSKNTANINKITEFEIKSANKNDQYEIRQSQTNGSNREKDYLEIADIYFDNQQYETAVEYYKNVININQYNDFVYYKMAKAYLALDNQTEAEININKALRLSPSNKDYEYFKSQIKNTALTRGDRKAAVEKIKNYYNADYYNQKGIEYYQAANLDKAEEFFIKALEFSPDSPKVYNNLASIEYIRDNLNKALEYNQKSIKYFPQYSDAYYNLALIYKKRNDKVKELENLNRVIELAPDKYQAYYSRAISKYADGDVAQAKSDFLKVLELKRDHYAAYRNLATIYANELNPDQAIEYYTKALMYNDKDVDTYMNLASLYQSVGRKSEAIECYFKAMDLSPQDHRIFFSLGKAYLAASNTENALESFRRAAQLNSNDPELYNYLGLSYQYHRRYKDARDAFLEAIALKPDRPVFHYNLSQCYLAMNDKKRSKIEFDNAIQIAPKSVQDFIDMAKIFADQQLTDYAIRILNQGISAHSGSEPLYILLADIYEKAGDVKTAKLTLEQLVKIKPNAALNSSVKFKLNTYGG